MQEIKIEKVHPVFSMPTLAEFLALDYKTISRMRRQGRIPVPDFVVREDGKKKPFPRWKYETIMAVIESGVI